MKPTVTKAELREEIRELRRVGDKLAGVVGVAVLIKRLGKLTPLASAALCVVTIWVAVKEQAKGWATGYMRAPHDAEVCEACVERLANALTAIERRGKF